jgi:porin
MGLWPGGLIKVNAQTRYGDDNNFNTGALFPVNLISLYPDAVEECYTALSDWYITQFFSPRLAVLVGKVSFRESNVFAHNETDQFLSMPLNFNPLPGITLPTMSTLMAGVIVRPTDWLMISTFVADPEGRAGVVGFDTAFDRGTTLMQTAEVAIKPFGLPGHQRVGWTWTDQSLVQLQQDPRLILSNIQRGLEPPVRTADSDWSFLYDFDQFLYTVPGHPDRGLGVFGRFGLSDGKVNMMRAFYSVGIGGKGLIPGRERDSFGVGYYYLDLSSDMPQVLRDQTHDEQGVELYYRISVTPWLHITPDVQIINPAARDIGTTWVAGVRMTIDL